MKKIFYSIVLSVFLLGSANLYADSLSSSDVDGLTKSSNNLGLEAVIKISPNSLTVDLDKPASLISNGASIKLGKLSYTFFKARITSLQVSFGNSRDLKKPTRLFIYKNKQFVASLNVKKCSLQKSKLQCKFDKNTSQLKKSFNGRATLRTKKS